MLTRQRLSYRLTRLCLLGTVILGTLLALGQIGVDAVRESQRIDQRMASTLSLVRESAAEAAYNIDDALGRRVVLGLVQHGGVVDARIRLSDRELARASGSVTAQRWRVLTDALFRPQREYALPLLDPDAAAEIGQLSVVLDTSLAGADFVSRSALVILSGLVRAVVLATLLLTLLYWVLTRPLAQLTARLSAVDPAAPERASLPIPSGHEQDELGQSVRAINGLLASIRANLAARAEAEDQASFLRQFDPLTQLPNRALFHDRMQERLQHARRSGERLTLLLLDIRGFHHLNDAHGFEFGDRVLRAVAERIRQALDEGDQVARMAGDRFALLAGYDGQVEAALSRAELVRATLQTPLDIDQTALHLDLRVGLALYPQDAGSAELLLQNAESALSVAQRPGHSGIQFYETHTGEDIRARHRLRQAIEKALAADEFELHYQPQFDARDARLTGVEALLRWPQALAERVSTLDLIRLAEDSGQILPLGEWILRRACATLAEWRAAGLPEFRMAINISPHQLEDARFLGTLDAVLAATGVDPQQLELELTETAMMRNIDQVVRQLEAIRDRGLGIAVDDFGTGHSSLQYLKMLPVTTLKIDRTFVRDLCSDAGDAQIVDAILGLGHSLRKRVIAEGISEENQLRALQARDCDEVQGFLLSAPLVAADLVRLVRDPARQRALILGGEREAV